MNLVLIILFSILILGGLVYYGWRLWRRFRVPPQELYVCLDGHLVRSRGEWMIDAALLYLGVPHEYEPRIVINHQPLHPDFGLMHGIYLEYWGLDTRSYRKIKDMKKDLFTRGNYRLINIENEDLKNLVAALAKKLRPFHLLEGTPSQRR